MNCMRVCACVAAASESGQLCRLHANDEVCSSSKHKQHSKSSSRSSGSVNSSDYRKRRTSTGSSNSSSSSGSSNSSSGSSDSGSSGSGNSSNSSSGERKGSRRRRGVSKRGSPVDSLLPVLVLFLLGNTCCSSHELATCSSLCCIDQRHSYSVALQCPRSNSNTSNSCLGSRPAVSSSNNLSGGEKTRVFSFGLRSSTSKLFSSSDTCHSNSNNCHSGSSSRHLFSRSRNACSSSSNSSNCSRGNNLHLKKKKKRSCNSFFSCSGCLPLGCSRQAYARSADCSSCSSTPKDCSNSSRCSSTSSSTGKRTGFCIRIHSLGRLHRAAARASVVDLSAARGAVHLHPARAAHRFAGAATAPALHQVHAKAGTVAASGRKLSYLPRCPATAAAAPSVAARQLKTNHPPCAKRHTPAASLQQHQEQQEKEGKEDVEKNEQPLQQQQRQPEEEQQERVETQRLQKQQQQQQWEGGEQQQKRRQVAWREHAPGSDFRQQHQQQELRWHREKQQQQQLEGQPEQQQVQQRQQDKPQQQQEQQQEKGQQQLMQTWRQKQPPDQWRQPQQTDQILKRLQQQLQHQQHLEEQHEQHQQEQEQQQREQQHQQDQHQQEQRQHVYTHFREAARGQPPGGQESEQRQEELHAKAAGYTSAAAEGSTASRPFSDACLTGCLAALSLPSPCRQLFVGSALTAAASEALTRQLLQLQTEPPAAAVSSVCLYINSPGSEGGEDSCAGLLDLDWLAPVALMRGSRAADGSRSTYCRQSRDSSCSTSSSSSSKRWDGSSSTRSGELRGRGSRVWTNGRQNSSSSRRAGGSPSSNSRGCSTHPRGGSGSCSNKRPIIATVVVGRAWGTAALLLASGNLGYRAATRNASILLRFPLPLVEPGSARELRTQAAAVAYTQALQADLLAAAITHGRRPRFQKQQQQLQSSLRLLQPHQGPRGHQPQDNLLQAAEQQRRRQERETNETQQPEEQQQDQRKEEDDDQEKEEEKEEDNDRSELQQQQQQTRLWLLRRMQRGLFLNAEEAQALGLVDHVI